jgi:hypothetical protein
MGQRRAAAGGPGVRPRVWGGLCKGPAFAQLARLFESHAVEPAAQLASRRCSLYSNLSHLAAHYLPFLPCRTHGQRFAFGHEA